MTSKTRPLSRKALAAYEANRNLAVDLLQSIREIARTNPKAVLAAAGK